MQCTHKGKDSRAQHAGTGGRFLDDKAEIYLGFIGKDAEKTDFWFQDPTPKHGLVSKLDIEIVQC